MDSKNPHCGYKPHKQRSHAHENFSSIYTTLNLSMVLSMLGRMHQREFSFKNYFWKKLAWALQQIPSSCHLWTMAASWPHAYSCQSWTVDTLHIFRTPYECRDLKAAQEWGKRSFLPRVETSCPGRRNPCQGKCCIWTFLHPSSCPLFEFHGGLERHEALPFFLDLTAFHHLLAASSDGPQMPEASRC